MLHWEKCDRQIMLKEYAPPLITPSRFFSDSNYLGSVELFPKQRDIALSFLEGDYQVGVWCLGRRSGKTFLTALIAVYLAIACAPVFREYVLDGESFYLLFVANSQEQAQLILRQVKLIFHSSPILKRAVSRNHKDKQTALHLTNGAVFKVLPNNPESVRGYPAAFVSLDEAAFYGSGEDKKHTGEALQSALEPAIAQFGRASKMLLTSTPWAKKGLFFSSYQKGISGKHPEVQSLNHPTWEVNPKISTEFLDAARQRDPLMFEVEYGANFAVDFASFFDAELIQEAVRRVGVKPPDRRFKYFLALDPALSGDAYTAAIAHRDGNVLVIDLLHEFLPKFFAEEKGKNVVSLQEVENWILAKNKEYYGFSKIVLDQYQSQATIQRLKTQLGSNRVHEFTWTAKSKTEAYSSLKALFNQKLVELYDHEQAIAQLINLRVVYGSGGRWTVNGGSGLKVDDYCSVIACLSSITTVSKRPSWATNANAYK